MSIVSICDILPGDLVMLTEFTGAVAKTLKEENS